jgi:hypothetical protein
MTVQGQNECGTGAESGPLPIVVNAIPVPAITGENLVCKAQVATYIVQNQAGSSFIWTISGGAITSGQGTSQVSVLWGNPGPGSVAVAETAASGCIGNSALFQVTIDVCTGLPHVNADEFTIYPNPATTTLNIVFPLHAKGLYSISVFNHLGQMVSRQTKVSARESGVMLLDISSFLPGIYTIVLSSETGIQSRVFVKE